MADQFHHALLDKISRELAEEYQRIQEELKAKPENIQLSGYLAERVWKRLLSPWMPPPYEFELRHHLLYELLVDGTSRSPETDLILLHPSYPEGLRGQQEVLISGVVGAFSVKLTLTPDGLREAIEWAAQLRRGMRARVPEPIGDLVSPLVTGVLAQSHRGFGKAPEEKVRRILEDAARELDGSGAPEAAGTYVMAPLVQHPRNELDFVCIADLNCWSRHPRISWREPDFGREENMFFASWTARTPVHEGETGRNAEPITVLISEMWQKLARRDPMLKPIADGFRMTGTPGVGVGDVYEKPLRPLVHADTYAALMRIYPSTSVDG